MAIDKEMKKELADGFEDMIRPFIEDVCSEYSPLEVHHIFEDVLSKVLLKQKLPEDKSILDTQFPVEHRIESFPEDVEQSSDSFKDYNLTHSHGHISIENLPKDFNKIGDLGIQIEMGKVWICINGVALLRFNPNVKKYQRGTG